MENVKYIPRRKTIDRNIILCGYCKGAGAVRVFTDDPRYDGPGYERCPECEGHGREIRILTTQYEVMKTETILKTL